MYVREQRPPQHSPIEDGAPVQGTWSGPFEEVDLLAIRRPFRYPLPRSLRDCRIKEWQSFIIQDHRFFLEVILSNVKLYRLAQVFLYDRESKEKLRYLKVIPLGGWKLPQGLRNASIDSHSLGFFFRIHNWLDADTIRVDLHIQAKRSKPAFTAHLTYDLDRQKVSPLVVNLSFSERRCVYAYKALAAVRGDMVFGGRRVSFKASRTSGFFYDFKGLFPYRMHAVWCSASGFDNQGRRIGFTVAENQTRESRRDNENALWVNGELTPLPAVRITQPGGIKAEWIIQDVEGMVDLVFTPLESLRSGYNVIFSRAALESPLGHYNGMLVSAKGEQIPVHNLWGTGEKLYLRV
ncbi:MAG: DUF2804 domain-containing protein [Treponema sp.]|jgi:hypothetical protein|nr:DUF2804 domain-containing protein [Treponema sp.]